MFLHTLFPTRLCKKNSKMGDIENQFREWSIKIDLGNDGEEVLEPGRDCCIYRVPQILRKINEEAYTPRLISIGPLHYGKRELMGMQKQKIRYWSKFGERVNPQKLEEFMTYIKNQEQRIRDHYAVSSTLKSSEYVAMILCDAVFIIELLIRSKTKTNDFLLKKPLGFHMIVDLLLLENQVPYFILDDLYTKAFPSNDHPSFFHLSVNFFYGVLESNQSSLLVTEPRVKHFTDLVRHAFVMEVQPIESNRGKINDLPTATKLNESGLNFSGIEGKCCLDITLGKRERRKWLPWFKVNELQIPQIKIFDVTEGLFRNMMALEQFHYPKQTHICNYVDLLDHLIDTVKDVDLLVDKGVIVNCVGDNEVIMKMFNKLCSHMLLSKSRYYDSVERMKDHHRYPWNHAKATLRSAYFSNIWTGTATVAATFLLILTVIQAVCSILQV